MMGLLRMAVLLAGAQAGMAYVFRQQRREYAGDRRHFLVTLGGLNLRPTADEIADAVVSVMAGGLALDLRETQLTARPARLEILAVQGGVRFIVPEDWRVQVEVQPVMGGIQDRRTGAVDAERPVDMVLSGRLIMAGLDITSE